MNEKIKCLYNAGKLLTYRYGIRLGVISPRPLVAPSGSIQKSFYGQNILAAQEGNNLCKKMLLSDEPCMLGRIGTVEMGVINAFINKKAGIIKHVKGERTKILYNNAGFFPDDEEMVCQFSQLYLECAADMDVFGVFNHHDEDLFQHIYAPKAKMTQFTTFEAFYFNSPWTYALKGKKVLVIHPFENSIKKQYNGKRKVLFDDPEMLPEFELLTIKAVQTIGDNTAGYNTWFDALNYMKEQIDNVEFDIALIGCGAYAFPLASYIKRKGKKSVITAGATQLLFGIKGARWDKAETPVPYKKTWIRPDESEKPSKSETVEGGCYW